MGPNEGSASLLTAGWLAAVWIAGVALLLVRILLGYGVMSNLRRQVRVHSTGCLFNVLQQARCALSVNAYNQCGQRGDFGRHSLSGRDGYFQAVDRASCRLVR